MSEYNIKVGNVFSDIIGPFAFDWFIPVGNVWVLKFSKSAEYSSEYLVSIFLKFCSLISDLCELGTYVSIPLKWLILNHYHLA